MNDIEEKSISTLRGKKIFLAAKNAIIALIIYGTIMIFSSNIDFYTNLFLAKHNHEIVSMVNSSELNVKEKASFLFRNGVSKNKNLTPEQQKILADAFTKYVIDEYSDSFTEGYLYNMYTSAKTVSVSTMPKIANKYGWYIGDYSSFINNISLNEKLEDAKERLIAHEQLHASLKKGLTGSGLTPGFSGYGLNEGLTSGHVISDYSYFDQYVLSCYIGCILGMDVVEANFFEGNLNGIKMELQKYLTKEECNRLIHNIDNLTFIEYFNAFLARLGIDFKDHYMSLLTQYENENIELLKKIFEAKTGLSATDSNYGRLLFGKGSIVDCEDIYEPFYYITFADSKKFRIEVHCLDGLNMITETYEVSDLSTFDIDKALEEIKAECKSQTIS